jgi:uncharacterized protein (TIGR02996 family)
VTAVRPLAEPLASVDRDPVAAYAALVEVWRETFDADVARAAARVAQHIVTPDDGWAGNADARQARWRALAPRGDDVVVRLELVRHTDFEKDRARDLVARLEAMATWPPDPVVARWLVDVFARQTRAAFLEGAKCFRRAFTALEAIIDRDGAARFASWIGTNERRLAATPAGAKLFDAGIARVLAKAESRLRDARPLADDERAAVAASGLAVEAPVPAAPADEAALLAAVLADPRDDAPRMVFADALLQRGDPRGEFIALDLLAARTAAQDRARNALLKAHGKQWLSDDLRHAVRTTTLRWQRGFPASATLKNHRQTTRELATLRELDLSDLPELPALALDDHRALESVVGIAPHVAPALVDRPVWRALSRIGLSVWPTQIDGVSRVLGDILHPGVREVVVGLRGEALGRQLPPLAFFRAAMAIVDDVAARPHVSRLELLGVATYMRGEDGALARVRVGIPSWLRGLLLPRFEHYRDPPAIDAWLAWIASSTGDVQVVGAVDDAVRAVLPVDAERLREVRSIAAYTPLVG